MTNESGIWRLKTDHTYYYQVQMQLAVCKLTYCDFVVWTQSEFKIERIIADDEFFLSKFEKQKNVFIYGMMPEIIGKW